MRWWPTACRPGDMIRVRIGSLWHYGVYVSDAEVIQFGPPPRGKPVPADEIHVCATSVDAFAGDDIIEVAQLSPWEKLRRVPPKETLRIVGQQRPASVPISSTLLMRTSSSASVSALRRNSRS